MSTNTYNELVAMIVKAVPEQAKQYLDIASAAKDGLYRITLEDVLRAWASKVETGSTYYLANYPEGTVIRMDELEWTCGKPLSEQSPETILFLHNLLK